jgi:hypothetical protein
VRYIINVKYLEKGISSSDENRLGENLKKDIIIFGLD